MALPPSFPPNYRTGIEMMAWLAFSIMTMLAGVYFFNEARKTQMVNKRDILKSFGLMLFFCNGLNQIFWQIGILVPGQYVPFGLFGYFCIYFGMVVFTYYWEKHLLNFHYIPTIINLVMVALLSFPIGYYAIFGTSWIFYDTITSVGDILAFAFLLSLIFKYSRRVTGILRGKAQLLFVGILITLPAAFLDNELTYELVPGLTSWVSVIIYICGSILGSLGIKGTIDGLSAFSRQSTTCIVHRGPIQKPDPIYYCTSCFVPYCQTCYEAVVKAEGCWNCHEGKPGTILQRENDATVQYEDVQAIDDQDHVEGATKAEGLKKPKKVGQKID